MPVLGLLGAASGVLSGVKGLTGGGGGEAPSSATATSAATQTQTAATGAFTVGGGNDWIKYAMLAVILYLVVKGSK